MAIYRKVYTTFWTDMNVDENFTPEDKYFYLYLLTNIHTNLSGCYEIGKKQMANELGYDIRAVTGLLYRFENEHKVLLYDESTHELFIKHWSKYNWTKSPAFLAGVYKEAKSIHADSFRGKIMDLLVQYGYEVEAEYSPKADGQGDRPIDGLVDGLLDRHQTTDYSYSFNNVVDNNNSLNTKEVDINTINTSVVDIENNNNNVRTREEKTELKEAVENIVGYLNEVTGKHFSPKKEGTISHISARFKEGYKIEDFHTVIDIKARDWIGTEQEKYLRPETLFGSKFESYLNEQYIKATKRWERGTGRKYRDNPTSWEQAAEEVKQRRINGYDNRADCEIDQSDSSSVPELPFSVQ